MGVITKSIRDIFGGRGAKSLALLPPLRRCRFRPPRREPQEHRIRKGIECVGCVAYAFMPC